MGPAKCHFWLKTGKSYYCILARAVGGRGMVTFALASAVMYLWIDAVITKLIMVFVERRYKIDTSRLFHCKDNCLNCVIE